MKTRLLFSLALLVFVSSGTLLFAQHAVSDRLYRMGREQFERRRINPPPAPPVMPVDTNALATNRLLSTNVAGLPPQAGTNAFGNPTLSNSAAASSMSTNRRGTNRAIMARPTYVTITNNGRVMPVVVVPPRPGANAPSGTNVPPANLRANAQPRSFQPGQAASVPQGQSAPATQARQQ